MYEFSSLVNGRVSRLCQHPKRDAIRPIFLPKLPDSRLTVFSANKFCSKINCIPFTSVHSGNVMCHINWNEFSGKFCILMMTFAKKGLPQNHRKSIPAFSYHSYSIESSKKIQRSKMRRHIKKTVFVTFLMICAVLPAMGWDDVGHKITGYIAWQRMSPQARENVIKILRAAPEDSQLATFYKSFGVEPEDVRKLEYFMFVPSWADVIRDRAFDTRYKKYHKSNWHYSDIFWKQVNGNVELLSGFEEGGQAVNKLVEFDAVIRNSSASNADKAIAIAWILHLGGDIHQPLHTSARVTDMEPKGDQGGNLFLLSPAGTPRENQLNLHWYWDSIVGRNVPLEGNMCEREYIEMLGKKMMKEHPFAEFQNKLNLGKYAEWQKESFAYDNTVVFPVDLKRNEIPSEKYKKNAFKVAESQLALAGYRLGETLNAVFGAPAPLIESK